MNITYKEILSTPDSLKKTKQFIEEVSDNFIKFINNNDNPTVFLGCGSSYSLAKSLALITQINLNKPASAIAGGDLLVNTNSYINIINNSNVVVISRSGSTSEILYSVEKLRKLECPFKLIAITCVDDSPISKISDIALDMPWAFDKSVCQTRTVTCMYFAFVLLVAKASCNNEMIEDLYKTMNLLPDFINKYEQECSKIAAINWSHSVVLGDAQLSGICEEAALAYKEICHIPSNFYNILDSRHGPIVLFNEKTLVTIAVSMPLDNYISEYIKEVSSIGSKIVIYSDLLISIENINSIVFGEKICHSVRGIPFIVINQLIAYYKSKHTGANPDQPKGLNSWIKL